MAGAVACDARLEAVTHGYRVQVHTGLGVSANYTPLHAHAHVRRGTCTSRNPGSGRALIVSHP